MLNVEYNAHSLNEMRKKAQLGSNRGNITVSPTWLLALFEDIENTAKVTASFDEYDPNFITQFHIIKAKVFRQYVLSQRTERLNLQG